MMEILTTKNIADFDATDFIPSRESETQSLIRKGRLIHFILHGGTSATPRLPTFDVAYGRRYG